MLFQMIFSVLGSFRVEIYIFLCYPTGNVELYTIPFDVPLLHLYDSQTNALTFANIANNSDIIRVLMS